MAQHFLLSSAARSLSLIEVARMSEEEARAVFQAVRWSDNDGQPYCPCCGCVKVYAYSCRPIWKCAACKTQFSVTSGTIFQDHKRPIRDYLLAIAIFVNGAKGHSALQLSRDLNCQYKTAFVLAHKIREALSAEQAQGKLSGTVEVDGAYFGGHVKPTNKKENRRDRRKAEEQTGKRQVVVVARERNGRTLPFVMPTEASSIPMIRQCVQAGSVVHADEAAGWDALHAFYDTKRINHSVAYSLHVACTNQAESFFSRLRRAEAGTHHKIAGRYLGAYACEMAWREDHRRESNGVQFGRTMAATAAHPVSRGWCGYWQRSKKAQAA
jgi:transposase-like protein